MKFRKIISVIFTASLLFTSLGQMVSVEDVFAGTVSPNNTDTALTMDMDEAAAYDAALGGDVYSVPEIPAEDEARSGDITSSDKWDKEYDSKGKSRITIDYSTRYGSADYSIKIANSDYTCATIGKNFSVKPNTMYRFSAMVKCADIEGDPADDLGAAYAGACVGEYWTYNHSMYYSGSDWKKLEYRFTTGEDTDSIVLGLNNGVWAEKCKGTVWFSDIMLEEIVGEKSNEWNVLTIVLKNVDVKGVSYNGEVIDYHDTFNAADVAYLKEYNEHSAALLEELSGGLMKVKNVDTVATDTPIDELAAYDWVSDPTVERSYSIHGYRLDAGAKCLSDILDRYIDGADKTYNVINLYAPLNGLSGDSTGTSAWLGLNGNYRGIYYTQMQYKSGSRSYDGDREAPAMVHELLHQLEIKTKTINPDMFIQLHARDINGYDNNRDWYRDYMQGKIHGSMGIDPSLYQVYSDVEYKLIFGNESEKPTPDPGDYIITDPSDIMIGSGEDLLKAFGEMNDPNQDYTITLVGDVQVPTLKLPKKAKSITIKSEEDARARLSVTTPKKLTARYPLTIKDIDFVCAVPVKIYCTKALTIENVTNLGSLVSKGNMTISGEDMSIAGSIAAKGRYTVLSMQNTAVGGKVSCGGRTMLENCHITRSLKSGDMLTLIGSNAVDGRVSAKLMESVQAE